MRALALLLLLLAAPILAQEAPAAPPAEEPAATPPADDSTPPADESAPPPADEAATPSADESAAPPADESAPPAATDSATPHAEEPAAEPAAEKPAEAPAVEPPHTLIARDTADVLPKGSVSFGVFNPLKVSVTDRLELSAHPLVFFVAPHADAKFALVQDELRLSGVLGFEVPTFGMRLTKGYLFPTYATSNNDIAWMLVPKIGVQLSGGPLDGNVWTVLAEAQVRVPFGVTNSGPLDSFLAPLDLLFAAPLTGMLGRAGAAYDLKLTQRLRLRGELNVYVEGPAGDLVITGQDVGPLRALSPWYFTAHLGLDVGVGKSSRFTAGVYFANYDQGATEVTTGPDGFADRVRVRSNNILPTLDYIWAW